MRRLVVVVAAVMATGCGGEKKTADDTLRAQIAKVRLYTAWQGHQIDPRYPPGLPL